MYVILSFILISIILLGTIGIVGAVVLYLASKKFSVREDPRINKIQEVLPASNCGGCGYPGCNGFATACVEADALENLNCPVGGHSVMKQVAGILGKVAKNPESGIAAVRCNGTCDNRPRINCYDGISVCSVSASLYRGETPCSYGCLGLGDCVRKCTFDAIRMNPETLLPEVDEKKCTGCGACVIACPKMLIQIRKKGPGSHRIYVSCMNKDRGNVARKACDAACIGCSKCLKVCSFDAISIKSNLAYIDYNKCNLCRKCVDECPTSAIKTFNF